VSKLHKAISFAEKLSAETGMTVAESFMFMGYWWTDLRRMALAEITQIEDGSYSFILYNRFALSNQQDELEIKLLEFRFSDTDIDNAWWKPEYSEVRPYDHFNLSQSIFGKLLHSIKIGSKEFVAQANMLLTEEVYNRVWQGMEQHVSDLKQEHIHDRNDDPAECDIEHLYQTMDLDIMFRSLLV